MSNPPKKKGTAWESACVNYLSAVAGIEVWRAAPHGIKDEGDLRMMVHGHVLAAECKCVERVTPKTMASFRLQTIVEADRAGAEGGVLLQWRPGKGYRWDASPDGQRAKSFGENLAHMTIDTLLLIAGVEAETPDRETAAKWVTLSMADFAWLVAERRERR